MNAAPAGARLAVTPQEASEKAARPFWGGQGGILVPGEREWPALIRQLDPEDPSYRNCRSLPP